MQGLKTCLSHYFDFNINDGIYIHFENRNSCSLFSRWI